MEKGNSSLCNSGFELFRGNAGTWFFTIFWSSDSRESWLLYALSAVFWKPGLTPAYGFQCQIALLFLAICKKKMQGILLTDGVTQYDISINISVMLLCMSNNSVTIYIFIWSYPITLLDFFPLISWESQIHPAIFFYDLNWITDSRYNTKGQLWSLVGVGSPTS